MRMGTEPKYRCARFLANRETALRARPQDGQALDVHAERPQCPS